MAPEQKQGFEIAGAEDTRKRSDPHGPSDAKQGATKRSQNRRREGKLGSEIAGAPAPRKRSDPHGPSDAKQRPSEPSQDLDGEQHQGSEIAGAPATRRLSDPHSASNAEQGATNPSRVRGGTEKLGSEIAGAPAPRKRSDPHGASGAKQHRTNPSRVRGEEERQAKLQTILDAALDVFAQKGFAEARLEDVAARAGVAKGTIYLYFASKQALFEALVHSGIAAPIEAMESKILAQDLPVEAVLRMLFTFLRIEVLGTRRQEIVRLLITEGSRFPTIAEFYHREVLTRGLGMLRRVANRAVERGEFRSDELVRFPQLVVAPAVVAVLWAHLFQRLEPLEIEPMFDAHIALLMRALKDART
jgi:AcrR family transcriptional regulator